MEITALEFEVIMLIITLHKELNDVNFDPSLHKLFSENLK